MNKNLPKDFKEKNTALSISKVIVYGMDIGVKGYIIKSSENLDMIVGEIEKTLAKFSTPA